MGFIQRFLGQGAAAPNAAAKGGAGHSRPGASHFPSSQDSRGVSPQSVRKEIMRVVLTEMLDASGIPIGWLGIEALAATSSGRDAGVHVRLVIRHWDERLLRHSMAFQDEYVARLHAMDPESAKWLAGVSWKFALPADADYPAMPEPDSWMALPAVQPPSNSMIAELDRMMAAGDEEARRRPVGSGFAPTEPSPLR